MTVMDEASYFCMIDECDRCVSSWCNCGCHADDADDELNGWWLE